MKIDLAVLKNQGIGIGKSLKIGTVIAGRRNPPFFEMGCYPLGAGIEFFCPGQAAGIFFRSQFLHIAEERMAGNGMEGLEYLLFIRLLCR